MIRRFVSSLWKLPHITQIKVDQVHGMEVVPPVVGDAPLPERMVVVETQHIVYGGLTASGTACSTRTNRIVVTESCCISVDSFAACVCAR